MSSLLFISTNYFDCDSEIPFSINDLNLYTVQSEEELDRLFPNSDIWLSLGKVFKKSLIKKPFFFAEITNEQRENLLVLINLYIRIADQLFQYLWFIKDCNCQLGLAAFYLDKDSSNILTLNGILTKADGTYQDSIFKLSDTQLVAKINKKLLPSIQSMDVNDLTLHYRKEGVKVVGTKGQYHEANRINRSLGFITFARKSSVLPQKISFYVMALEALFSGVKNVEIKFRIAQRVAQYIGSSYDECQEINRNVRTFYDIRSSFVHGQTDKKLKDKDKIMAWCIELDNIVRRVMEKIVENDQVTFLGSDESLEQWFTKQMFSQLNFVG